MWPPQITHSCFRLWVCLSVCVMSFLSVKRNSFFSDVAPFLEAVENMWTYYETRGVDIFKEAVSGNFLSHYYRQLFKTLLVVVTNEMIYCI